MSKKKTELVPQEMFRDITPKKIAGINAICKAADMVSDEAFLNACVCTLGYLIKDTVDKSNLNS